MGEGVAVNMLFRILTGLMPVIAVAIVPYSAQSYEVAAVSGGGTIEGIVRYRGDVPMKKIIPSKNVETCGGPREEPLMRRHNKQEPMEKVRRYLSALMRTASRRRRRLFQSALVAMERLYRGRLLSTPPRRPSAR